MQYPGYNCFGCSPENPVGIHLDFVEEGDFITAQWQPGSNYQGYFNVLHGGIQSLLMDELASWVVYVKAGIAGVTSRLKVKFIKAIYIDKGYIKIFGKIERQVRNIYTIKCWIENNKGEKCAEASIDFFTFSEEKSKKDLYYPGKESFYSETP